MGVLDALTILGAGIGRGYRGSQEVQRQIAEQKRKALLEEREQIVKETTARSQQALTEAQIQTEALNRAIGQFGLDVNKKKAERSEAPITRGGTPLRARILGNEVNLPGTMQSLTDQGDLLRQLSEEQFKSTHPEYFTNYPPAGTAASQIKNSPESRGRDYIHEILSGSSPMGQMEDSEAYSVRMARERAAKLNFLMQNDPEAIKTFLQKGKKSSAETDTSYLDEPALEPEKNRFKIKVKK